MFKWLADMLVKTPVQSSCSCCEGKNNGCKNAGGNSQRRH